VAHCRVDGSVRHGCASGGHHGGAGKALMAVKANLRVAAASDPGRRRKNNEDRYYVDSDRGIYAVIDGVGGHAAGETAAGLAVDVIRERMERQTGTPEERIREAITLANNEIYRLSRTRPEWNGMACVLTLALIEDDNVTIGHVGDSRLYLLRSGEIQKITHDHSPVGEREDRGELSEAEAMRHARRNEIYRDVGSSERNPDDTAFIEMEALPMPWDGALLLCSDGLTDLVTSAEIRAGVERYAPDFDAAIRALIDAANQAGGKDNITVVLVAGPAYGDPHFLVRDKTTTVRKSVSYGWLFAMCGLAIGVAAGLAIPVVRNSFAVTGPRTLLVGAIGIAATMDQAHSGDTVVIPQGRYRERVELRQGVTLRAQVPGTVTLTSPDGGPALVAKKMTAGGVEGVWIQGDLEAPLSTGMDIDNSSPFVSNVRITGANVGIEVRGVSAPVIISSQITNNHGAGILVLSPAAPRIENNLIAANGNDKPGAPKPGVEALDGAHPLLKDNGVVDNGAEPIWIHGQAYQPADFEENFFGGIPAKKAIRLISAETAAPEKARAAKPGTDKAGADKPGAEK
jgi:serine/threonine protein phosphatase PrpC